MNDFQFITPSEVMEYLFCPRFVYFMNVLKVEQHEHRRTLVNKGRDIHKLKMVQNKDYLRKKAGAVDKLTDVYLSSDKLKLVGKVDEVFSLMMVVPPLLIINMRFGKIRSIRPLNISKFYMPY